MSTTKVNIHEYPEDASLLPQYRVAVMQAALEGKPVEVASGKRPLRWWVTDSPEWAWSTFSYRIVPSKLASGHNPDDLTEDQIGVKDGYRTLSVEENQELEPNMTLLRGLQYWDEGAWVNGAIGGSRRVTYRTKHPIGHFLSKTPPKVTRYFRHKDGLFKPAMRDFPYWIEVLPDGSSFFGYLDGEYRGANESWTLAQCEAHVASGDWVEFDGNVEPFRPKPVPAHWTDKLPKEYADLAKKRRAEFVALDKDYHFWRDTQLPVSFNWERTPEGYGFWMAVSQILNGLQEEFPPIPGAPKPKVKKLIPWTLETAPFPCVLRTKDNSSVLYLPYRADCDGMHINEWHHYDLDWEGLLAHWEYSLNYDNHTWLPCGTEVDSE